MTGRGGMDVGDPPGGRESDGSEVAAGGESGESRGVIRGDGVDVRKDECPCALREDGRDWSEWLPSSSVSSGGPMCIC